MPALSCSGHCWVPPTFRFVFTRNPASEIASTTRSNDSYAYTGHANANVTGTANGLNQLTAVGGVSNSHDSRGNVSAVGANSYGYSSENLLTSGPSSTTLSYDPANRLYQTAGGATTRFGYDGGQLIGEYDSSNALQRRYVFGPGTDEPLVQYEGSGTSTRRWFHAGERGSVAAVSDASGDVVTAVNRYDEYGNVQGTLTGRFGYTGQAWLPEIGMAYYRARIYNPAMGRFMQTDPIGMDGGMNVYAYVGNNPVNFTDPLGLQCSSITTTWAHVVYVAAPNGGYYPGKITDKWDVSTPYCTGDPSGPNSSDPGVSGSGDALGHELGPSDGDSDVTVVGTRRPKVKLAGQDNEQLRRAIRQCQGDPVCIRAQGRPLPPGYTPWSDAYMRGPDGKLHIRPDWQARVDAIRIDWCGVASDLLLIGTGVAGRVAAYLRQIGSAAAAEGVTAGAIVTGGLGGAMRSVCPRH